MHSPRRAPVEIAEVVSRSEQDAFIKFPWRVYKDDPAWVPPLLIERKAFLNRKTHPFYRHGDAALFLARRDGEIVGRIMASDDPNYNALHQTAVGCFGLFDCINDQEVSAALFDAAANWMRARGLNEVMGPIDYSTNYVCGLLIDGFQHPPMVLTAHNPPYYSSLIEGWGFEKVKDWYAWWFDDFPEPAQRLRKVAAARVGKRHVSTRPINLGDMSSEAERIRSVYNRAWKKNWGFVPFTEAETEHLTKELKPIVKPEGVLIAESGTDPVGFVIGVPDINAALRHLNGRLTWFGLPIGLIKLLYYQRKVRTGRLIALGVVEEYRRAGVAELLILQFMEEAYKQGYSGELSMTLEDNVMVNRFIEAMGAKRYKTYRIYRRSL